MQKKIAMFDENDNFFDEIFELFVVSKTANGVSDATLRNYHYHKKAIATVPCVAKDLSIVYNTFMKFWEAAQ